MHKSAAKLNLSIRSDRFVPSVLVPNSTYPNSKVLMSLDAPGSAEKCFDLVRGMIIADSMESVTLMAQSLLSNPDIHIVRIKDRYGACGFKGHICKPLPPTDPCS